MAGSKGDRPRGGQNTYRKITDAKDFASARTIADRAGIHMDEAVSRDVPDENLLRKSLTEAAWIKSEFPIVGDVKITSDPGHHTAFMYSRVDRAEIAFAGFTPNNMRDRVNTYLWSTRLTDRNGLTDSPRGTNFEHVTTHEMAHQVVRSLSDRLVFKLSNGAVTTADRSVKQALESLIVDRAYKSLPQSVKGRKGIPALSKQISSYAYTGGRGETIAEAMADYRANGSKSSPLSQAIYTTLKELTSRKGIQKLADELK